MRTAYVPFKQDPREDWEMTAPVYDRPLIVVHALRKNKRPVGFAPWPKPKKRKRKKGKK